jgi:UDP:flavonoid glycosyltransferase YjiC (YdhE family)
VPGEATVEAVGNAVTDLLTDESFGEAARRISASIASMPSPDDVAAVLETLP